MAAVRLSVTIIIISVTIVGTNLSPLILQQQSYARIIEDGKMTCNFACDSVGETSKFTPFPQAVVVSTIPVGTNPVGIAFNPYNGNMYVTNSASNDISVIDIRTNIIIETIPVGKGPVDLAFNPYNGDMYVDNSVTNSTPVIDITTNTVIDTIPVGEGPRAIAFNPYNGDMYTANLLGNSISIIDTRTNTYILYYSISIRYSI